MPTCKGCGAEIIWIKTEAGRNMPIDAKPIKAYLPNPQYETLYALEKTEKYILQDVHLTHWATCKTADKFKKK
jgi:hypothetical protein